MYGQRYPRRGYASPSNPWARRPARRSYNNLEYYINGQRVTKIMMADYLSRMYHVPPSKIIESRVSEAKALMNAHGCTSWQFSDGTFFKY